MFQSTRPVWGATQIRYHGFILRAFQSTRPMRGATRDVDVVLVEQVFQSTRPMRGATMYNKLMSAGTSVSIHAPHAGRDQSCTIRKAQTRCFNPRAPCGARQHGFCITTASKMFQSTRPMRGATTGGDKKKYLYLFQSTRPMRGATSQRSAARREDRSFNPRAPCGARPQRYNTFIPFQGFNPRAPCGARRFLALLHLPVPGFNPRAPCGARRQLESRLPPFATYLWAFPSTNTIFSASETHAPPAA